MKTVHVFFHNKLLIRNSTRNVRFETVATLLTAAYPASQHCCEAENAAAKSKTVMKKYEIARLTNPSQSLIAAEELALLFETFPILKHPLSESNFVSTPLPVWYSIEAPGRILSLFCNSNCMILPNALICKKREKSKRVWKQLHIKFVEDRKSCSSIDWMTDKLTDLLTGPLIDRWINWLKRTKLLTKLHRGKEALNKRLLGCGQRAVNQLNR